MSLRGMHVLLAAVMLAALGLAWLIGGLSSALLAFGASLLLLGVWNLWMSLQIAIGEQPGGVDQIEASEQTQLTAHRDSTSGTEDTP